MHWVYQRFVRLLIGVQRIDRGHLYKLQSWFRKKVFWGSIKFRRWLNSWVAFRPISGKKDWIFKIICSSSFIHRACRYAAVSEATEASCALIKEIEICNTCFINLYTIYTDMKRGKTSCLEKNPNSFRQRLAICLSLPAYWSRWRNIWVALRVVSIKKDFFFSF